MESINKTGYHVRLIICGLHVKQYETKFIGNDPILITCEHSQVNKTLSPSESTVKCTLKGFTIPLGSDQTRCCCSEQRIPVVVVVVVVVCVLWGKLIYIYTCTNGGKRWVGGPLHEHNPTTPNQNPPGAAAQGGALGPVGTARLSWREHTYSRAEALVSRCQQGGRSLVRPHPPPPRAGRSTIKGLREPLPLRPPQASRRRRLPPAVATPVTPSGHTWAVEHEH